MSEKVFEKIKFKLVLFIKFIKKEIDLLSKRFMRLLKSLFGKRFKEDKSKEEERSKYAPEQELPVDERFMVNFKNNGGKFLYCLDEREVKNNFYYILKENNWDKQVCCFDQELKSLFAGFDLEFTNDLQADFCLLPCEFLIANTGSLMLTSNQIGEKKLSQLPQDFVVLARTSQLLDTPSDALRIINTRKQNLPSNITTIKNFVADTEKEEHFLNYGSVSKNLYLLLLEDL